MEAPQRKHLEHMSTSLLLAGKTYRVNHSQKISDFPNLAKAEPNTVAWHFVDHKGRAYLVRELSDGTYSKPTTL